MPNTVFATERMNLIEAYNREGYTNSESLLGELLLNNDFLRVAAVLPANHGAIHKTLVADQLGEGKIRAANEGIVSLSGKTHIKDDPVVSYEGDSEVDELILDAAPDPMKARLSEDAMNLVGFSNGWNKVLLDGNKKDSDGFEGIATRRSKLSNPYTISIGEEGDDLTSAYLVEFGETALALRYLQHGAPGFQTRDNGRVKADAQDGGYFWAWSQHYQIRFGISIRQERALWRLCNASATGTTIDTLLQKFIIAKNKLPHRGNGSFLFCNNDLQSRFEIGMINKATNLRTIEIQNYGPVLYFANVAIMQMDSIPTGETEVA